MKNQKRILEIFIYVLLLAVGLFFYLSDKPLLIQEDNFELRQENIQKEDGLQEVPQELIDYDFKFEGD